MCGGGRGWWLSPIFVFRFSLQQAEQLIFMKFIGFTDSHNSLSTCEHE